MAERLHRLLKPSSIAVIGGGAWCANVVTELARIGFGGPVWRVHPREGYPSVKDLPAPPDAAFIGVNRQVTIDIVRALSASGAGGAVCFASGFAEAEAELSGAVALQASLLEAAGGMPILGPNCYGLINYLDRVALWPDQHGGLPVARGVGLITQSSNIAINLTMQARGLPIAYVVTAGNQAQQSLTDISQALLEDPRVTALGLHIEGVGDVAAFHALARQAEALGKAIIALKIGGSEQARAATMSHTASLAGSETGARMLFRRLGIAQVETLDGLLEALKIAHLHGKLPDARIASLSCSGGEASLMADLGARAGIDFPVLRADQKTALRAALGPKVALANPLDYHTYIWGDVEAMTAAFSAMMTPDHAMGLLVLDTPRADRCDPSTWEPAFSAAARAREQTGRPMAVLASLPETMPEILARRLMAEGLVPLSGIAGALEAIASLAVPACSRTCPAPPRTAFAPTLVHEATAKARLASHGLPVPRTRTGPRDEVDTMARDIGFPVVVKTVGEAHKTGIGGVAVGLSDDTELAAAMRTMPGNVFLVEEMVSGAVAELLIGITSDPAHGLLLTIGRGGTETELHADTAHTLVPADASEIRAMLSRLRCAPLLTGYRGCKSADIDAILQAVLCLQDFMMVHPDVVEIEVNPLLCRPDGAVVVDALISEAQAQPIKGDHHEAHAPHSV